MAYGVDALWYPVGFVAGYFVLLLFVAAPLRRSGAYTVPRLRGGAPRLAAAAAAVRARRGRDRLLYLVPQLQGAGLTLRATTGAPAWVGAVLVAVVVTVNVAGGGMRSATFVQAFQYWLKLTALACRRVPAAAGRPTAVPPLAAGARRLRRAHVGAGRRRRALRRRGAVDVLVDGPAAHARRRAGARAGSTLVFPAGAPCPHVERARAGDRRRVGRPLSGAGGVEHPLYATYALVLATFLGTMGLPHVLVRFYTNPDGRAARRTTLGVLALLGVFYLLPSLYGALGRLYVPELLLTGRTDAVVLALPVAALAGTGGQLLQALLVAGAFAAFLSTSSGLLVTTSGVLAQDLLRSDRPGRLARGSVRRFQLAAAGTGAAALALALLAGTLPLTQVVGLAFAVAASTFCPLLVLGIWWRGPDGRRGDGRAARRRRAVHRRRRAHAHRRGDGGWPGALLAQPGAWTVPTAFAVMVVGSLLTRRRCPADVGRTMLLLHAPDGLDLPDTSTVRRP
jgi:Na+(H+)/acetate symporter ActP